MKNKFPLDDEQEKRICKPLYERFDTLAIVATVIFMVVLVSFSLLWIEHHYAKPIEGTSMQPGINNYAPSETGVVEGDIAIVDTRTNINYGDIVIINMSKATVLDENLKTKLLIKRVIALGGDSIKFEYDYTDGCFYTYLKKSNETEFTKLQEDYINPMTTSGSESKIDNFNSQINWATKVVRNADGSVTIPEGFYFAMGDNRDVSFDCRIFGPIENDSCMGIVESILKKGSFLNSFFTWVTGI